MNLPDLDNQVVVHPSGGVNEQTIDPGVNRHEAIIGLNLDYRGKTGAVMKRHPWKKITFSTFPSNYFSLYIFSIGDEIFQLIGLHDESGNFVETKLYRLKYYPEDFSYRWVNMPMPPANDFGYGLEIPHNIIDDSAVYQHKFEDTDVEIKERYLYLINNGIVPLEENERSRILIRRDRPFNVREYYTGALRLPNIPLSSITLTNVGGDMIGGYYYYHILLEDTAGNVGTAYTETERYWFAENQGYVYFVNPNAVNATGINIVIPPQAMPGLKYIHVFRIREGAPSLFPDEPPTPYNWIESVEVIGNTNEFVVIDNYADEDIVLANDVREAYFNVGLPPEDLLPPRKIYCGVVHQRRMFSAHENSIYMSLTNWFRNYHPDDVTVLTKIGKICALNSGYNQLNIFAEDSIWIWRGRSPAEMDIVKPKKIWDNGIPFIDIYDYKWHDTVRTSGQKTLFVDKDGWPRQIVNEQVLYLSSDGNKKVFIEPTDRINAAVIGNTYRITNGKKCWVCFLDRGNTWLEWDIEILRYLFQPYDGSIDKGENMYRDYDSLFLRNWNVFGQGDKFNDNGAEGIAIWKTAFIPVDGSDWVSLGFKIYKPNEEFTNVKDWGVGSGNGGGPPTSPDSPEGPEPPPPPPEPTPEQIIGIEIFLDGELDPKFRKQFKVTLNDPDITKPKRYGEPQHVHFKFTSSCERLSVKAYHVQGAEFELNRIGVTPRGAQ